MAGLDKMKSQILDEAKAAADLKLKNANEKADELLAQAEAEAKKTSESISQKAEKQVADYRDRVVSSIDLQRRTKVLAAKQELIREVLDKAYAALTGMEAEKYFDMLLKLLERYVLPQDGEIFFSSEDLKRMPADYEAKVKKIAQDKGGALSISAEGRKIENGFVLAYGGIEENCTLRAMFDEKKDELSDAVRESLFA